MCPVSDKLILAIWANKFIGCYVQAFFVAMIFDEERKNAPIGAQATLVLLAAGSHIPTTGKYPITLNPAREFDPRLF